MTKRIGSSTLRFRRSNIIGEKKKLIGGHHGRARADIDDAITSKAIRRAANKALKKQIEDGLYELDQESLQSPAIHLDVPGFVPGQSFFCAWLSPRKCRN